MNVYKIQNSCTSEAQYVICDTITEAIDIWKTKLQSKKDPEIVEWVADYFYTK